MDGHPEGCASADGRVWGTHLHGLLESGPARRHVLDWARGAPAIADAPAPPDHRALREGPTIASRMRSPPRSIRGC